MVNKHGGGGRVANLRSWILQISLCILRILWFSHIKTRAYLLSQSAERNFSVSLLCSAPRLVWVNLKNVHCSMGLRWKLLHRLKKNPNFWQMLYDESPELQILGKYLKKTLNLSLCPETSANLKMCVKRTPSVIINRGKTQIAVEETMKTLCKWSLRPMIMI